MNKQQEIRARYIAFVNHFKKVCDPQGLSWYIKTGRMGGNEISEITEAVGQRVSRDSVEELLCVLSTYGKMEIKTTIENKPRINNKLKQIADKWGNEIAARHAFYQV